MSAQPDNQSKTASAPANPPPHRGALLTNIEKTRRLKFGIAGDACNTIYLNLATAGSVLLMFMLTLGFSNAQMGILLAALGFGPMIAPLASQIGARRGFKRVSLTFNVVRVFLLAGMILAPHIRAVYGTDVAFAYVAAVLVAFGLVRSTADSQGGAWSLDYIPPAIRGKYSAIDTIVTMICGAGAIWVIGHGLGSAPPLHRFQVFFAIAIGFGLLPVIAWSFLPGGQPQRDARIGLGNVFTPLKDPVYRRHLAGHTMINLGWWATTPFVPLFLRKYAGLPADQVVMLDAISMVGALCSSFLWGWAADRYGGKPVMVSLLSCHVIYPIGMLLMPMHSYWTHAWAMAIVFSIGFVSVGWGIGFSRYFFNDLIPAGPARTDYIALNTAVAGLMIGSGPLWAGWVLDRMSNLHGNFGPITITPYTPFFVGLIFCILIAAWLMGGLPSRGGLPTRQFASMLLQANLLNTLPNLLAFHYAGHEKKRIDIVGKLGSARSPWNVEELIQALDDPSFGVCYEAIVSVTRTLRDPRLTDALLKVVLAADPGLQMAAVWALGRIGDPKALPVLRQLLDSPYRTLRAQAVRSVGMLGDAKSAPRLLAMFASEPDIAIRVAIGSALAWLGCKDVVPGLLELLRKLGTPAQGDIVADRSRRREVSLAIATLLGRDDQALRLWRRMHDQPGDTLGVIMLGLRRRLSPLAKQAPNQLAADIETCAYAFAADDLDAGAAKLREIVNAVRPDAFTHEASCVLAECCQTMTAQGIHRREYLLLAVHALHVGFIPA